MEKTNKKNWIVSGLLVLAFVFGLFTFLGVKSPEQKVYATDTFVAGSELKIETIIGGKHSTTFAGGKYLHLDPIDKNHYTNSVSANADMEYDETTGVLKIFETDNTDDNFYRYISIIATNTTAKKLTIKAYFSAALYVLDFHNGDLTITNGEGVHNAGLACQNKISITGKLTICGEIGCSFSSTSVVGLYPDSNSWVSANELEILDSAALRVMPYSSNNTYTCAVNVGYLTLNTDGYLLINANGNTNNSFTYVLYVAYQVNFTKCLYIYLSSPLDTVASLTNSSYFKNAVDTAPIEGYVARINRVKSGKYGDYGEDLYRRELFLGRKLNVSYNSNGGSGTMSSELIVYSDNLRLPACTFTAPQGKQFAGWAVGSADATPLRTPTSYIQIKEPTVIYAVWEDAPREFTSVPSNATKQVGQTFTATWVVNFDVVEYGVNFWNGSAWQELYHYDTQATPAGTQMSYDITSDAAGEKRYTIDCYYDEFHYLTSDEFTITWETPEPTEYMYVYVTNGAEGSNDINYADEGTEITLATPASINFVALEHYHFKGWAIGAVNATPLKQPGEKITISAETYIYAIWEEDTTYSVTYYANNGSGDDVGIYGLYAGEYTLKNITEFEFDAPSGKQFKGWSYSNNGEIINTATITLDDNKELYAIWEDIPVVKYAISFNSNGGTGTMANVEYAGTYTLPTCTFGAPQGKVFAGWAYSSNGAVIATAQITVSANIELFAIWGDAQYTITVNYGTASVNSATQGTTITLTADAPQEGYEFDKWTGVGVTFANENNATTTFVMPAGDVVVTATYKAVSAPVNPDPQVEPNPEDKGGLGAGAIVAIVLAVVVVGGVGGFALAWFVFQKKTWADLTAAIKKLGKKTGTKKSTTKKPASKKTTKSSTKETEEKK